MTAFTAISLHDPFSPDHHYHHHHYFLSPPQTSSTSAHSSLLLSSDDHAIAIILDLLAVDQLIDSYAPMKREESLWNELLAVDLECGRAHVRDYTNIDTAPALTKEKELLLDLLHTDREMDNNLSGQPSMRMELSDSYASTRTVHSTMKRIDDNTREKDEIIIMMHLLAMDEYVDGSKRNHKFIESEDYAIIGEMFMVDCEVSGAKRRALFVEDLQCLLDVDRFIDGCAQRRTIEVGA